MQTDIHVTIRPECLLPASRGWAQPTGAEVQEVMRRAGFTGRRAAELLNLSDQSGRQVRRWIAKEVEIPYSAWAILCHAAGLGAIWIDESYPVGEIQAGLRL